MGQGRRTKTVHAPLFHTAQHFCGDIICTSGEEEREHAASIRESTMHLFGVATVGASYVAFHALWVEGDTGEKTKKEIRPKVGREGQQMLPPKSR